VRWQGHEDEPPDAIGRSQSLIRGEIDKMIEELRADMLRRPRI